MKLIAKNVKDLDRFIEYLESKGYIVDEGSHAVLLDHSEISEIYIRLKTNLKAAIVAHYLTPYYMAELEDVDDEDKYLEKLLEIKHSGVKWRIPVNPLIGIILDDKLLEIFSEYSDDYPTRNGEEIVKEYRSRNKDYARIPRVVIAHLIEKIMHPTG